MRACITLRHIWILKPCLIFRRRVISHIGTSEPEPPVKLRDRLHYPTEKANDPEDRIIPERQEIKILFISIWSDGVRSRTLGKTSSMDSDQGGNHSIRDLANTVVAAIRYI